MGLCGGGHGLGCLAALGLQRGQCGGVALLGSSCGGVGLGLLAGVTLRDDLLLLLVQSSQPGRALEPGLLAFAALGGIHLQNGLHQVVDIFHAMHLTLWELYLGWVPCLPLRGAKGLFSI